MSREFAYTGGGYAWFALQSLHQTMRDEGAGATVPLVCDLLQALDPVVYGICSHEACDAGPEAPLIALVEQLPKLREALKALEAHAAPYEAVAKAALRKAAREGAC